MSARYDDFAYESYTRFAYDDYTKMEELIPDNLPVVRKIPKCRIQRHFMYIDVYLEGIEVDTYV